MRLPAALCKMQRKKRETDGFSKSTLMTPPGSHPTSGFGARHGPPKFFGHKKRRIVQNDAAKTKISPVDIPTGRDPRTKQQPTGLIAYPACGRAVLFESLQVPKPAFDLCVHKKAVSPVDIPSGWDPRASQSPTGALAASCGWSPFFESSLG